MLFGMNAGLHDPRVAYWEPAKFVAKLRDFKTDDNMQLFKCDFGAGAPTSQTVQQAGAALFRWPHTCNVQYGSSAA